MVSLVIEICSFVTAFDTLVKEIKNSCQIVCIMGLYVITLFRSFIIHLNYTIMITNENFNEVVYLAGIENIKKQLNKFKNDYCSLERIILFTQLRRNIF